MPHKELRPEASDPKIQARADARPRAKQKFRRTSGLEREDLRDIAPTRFHQRQQGREARQQFQNRAIEASTLTGRAPSVRANLGASNVARRDFAIRSAERQTLQDARIKLAFAQEERQEQQAADQRIRDLARLALSGEQVEQGRERLGLEKRRFEGAERGRESERGFREREFEQRGEFEQRRFGLREEESEANRAFRERGEGRADVELGRRGREEQRDIDKVRLKQRGETEKLEREETQRKEDIQREREGDLLSFLPEDFKFTPEQAEEFRRTGKVPIGVSKAPEGVRFKDRGDQEAPGEELATEGRPTLGERPRREFMSVGELQAQNRLAARGIGKSITPSERRERNVESVERFKKEKASAKQQKQDIKDLVKIFDLNAEEEASVIDAFNDGATSEEIVEELQNANQ